MHGGGPEHIYQLSKRLNRSEWDIIICTLKDGPYWDKFNLIGIKTYNLLLRKLLLSTPFKLFFILKKEKPDIVHTHGKGVCGIFTKEIAVTRSAQVNIFARENEHP